MSRLRSCLLHSLLATLLATLLLAPPLVQAATAQPALLGTWEGSLVMGREDMTLAFTFAHNGEVYSAAFTSSAMGIYGMPAELVSVDANRVTVRIARLDMEFNGTLRFAADGSTLLRIDGDYFQQSEMVPVVLLPVATPGL